MTLKNTKIPCPTCKKELVWNPANPYRPFCSKRCKLIDLGEWANEGYRVPGDPVDPNAHDENEQE